MSEQARPSMFPEGAERGRLIGRAFRYAAAVGAGYVFGLAAGRSVATGPGFWILAALGALALFLVFRSGVKSQVHAASDAIAVANNRAEASAAATAVQTVNVGNSFTDQAANHPSVFDVQRAQLPPTVQQQAVTSYVDDFGNLFEVRNAEPLPVEPDPWPLD